MSKKSLWFLDQGRFHNVGIKIGLLTFDLHPGLPSCALQDSKTHVTTWAAVRPMPAIPGDAGSSF